jgi:CxxC motif-containing protein
MNERQMTCILCPNGCEIDVRWNGEPTEQTIDVEGNLCPRGIGYALEELTHPKRTLTTSILVRNGVEPQTSVKTAAPIPREAIDGARRHVAGASLDAPVAIGQIVIDDVAGTGVAVVVTRSVPRREARRLGT